MSVQGEVCFLPYTYTISLACSLQLIEALKLAVLGAAGPLPNICGEPLVEVVEDMMNCHFFAPLLHNWSRQQEKGKLDQVVGCTLTFLPLNGHLLQCTDDTIQ